MIKQNLIFIDNNLSSQESVLEVIVDELFKTKLITDSRVFIDSVMMREEMMPTSVGLGVAIPHGKSKVVEEPFIAYMRTKNEFEWDHRNGELVRSIFLIGVPDVGGDKTHLRYISQISRKLVDQQFRDDLLSCENKEEVFSLLNLINKNIVKEEKE